ncbi:MAG TPA: MBL fold metallo-hydrolase [Acidimicrobiales bacterium]|nr:MBL fold metallo-hydrolase [Acidimicrobiales bacterium]
MTNSGESPLFFRQYELGCLSLYSYMIADEATGRAIVVDPQRDIEQYLQDAASRGLTIERIIETHFHADFVSGHLELAEATGAVISYGPGAQAEFTIEPLADGQRLSLGEVVLEVRATPGHTPESVSIVIWEHDTDDTPWGVLTGDTLFIGDVGRPDLLASAGTSPEQLARLLYQSLHDKLLSLPDTTRVFPAHGAGSACGRAMSSAPSSTIGEQRRTNYALAPMTEQAFITAVTGDQPTAPAYFAYAASTNRQTHQLLDGQGTAPALSLEEAVSHQLKGAAVIDGRTPQSFASGHLRGSINVSLDGRFAEYAGDVVDPECPIILVTDPGRESEARTRLARIGFDRTVGYLPDIESVLVEHPEQAQLSKRLPAADLATWIDNDPELQLVDVRNPSEHSQGAIPGAELVPLPVLRDRLGELDPRRPTVVFCASGNRSSVAASLLRAAGFSQVADVLGGFDAWAAAGLPTTRQTD